ncbi:cache domain-containing sensor histidine kinase [Paenibacillus sp. HW567]|uniref:cache domain-containing sensor histidine kinase n=1 Tax=Paenibacillus sp. HW567 TaxID=1034769 RepID=UPI000363DBE7|nr:sensor histidine kinase [Paenibacillus sp. HW567]
MRILRQLTHSVFFKFSAAFIVVGFIPLFMQSFYSYQTFTSHVERYTRDNLKQMILYMSYNVNDAFSQYDDITKLMYTGRYEGFIQGSNDNQAYNVNQLEQINSIPVDTFLKTLLFSDNYIASVFFIRESDGKVYHQTRNTRELHQDKLPLQTWSEALRREPKKAAFLPKHPVTYFMGKNEEVLTVGRNLIDTSGQPTAKPKILGTLYLDINASRFGELFSEIQLNDKDKLYVVDSKGRVFFSNQRDGKGAVQVSGPSDGTIMEFNEPVPALNGNIMVQISKERLYEQLTSTRYSVYFTIVFSMVVLILMGMWFSRRLAAPIRELIQQMVRVESGNLETRVDIKSKDELGRLGRGFNRMVERLRNYINEAYVAEIKQKQTELNALKSQIRPHYLYNTLEVIRMNAVHNDALEVGDMIASLSHQLKYVIDYGEEWVTLREELDHLHDYFYIIEVRFEGRYHLRVHIADGVDLNWATLKLSLQPFVENAIEHGLQPQGRGTVEVSIARQKDKLVMVVSDDGVGMNAEEYERLKTMLTGNAKTAGHVGMKNVQERIRSLCGEGYGLTVISRPHIGTSVTMEFPVKEVQENDQNSARG